MWIVPSPRLTDARGIRYIDPIELAKAVPVAFERTFKAKAEKTKEETQAGLLVGLYGPDGGRREDFSFLMARRKDHVAIFRLEGTGDGKRQVTETRWGDLCEVPKKKEASAEESREQRRRAQFRAQ